jgi:putative polyketide hydroxylase
VLLTGSSGEPWCAAGAHVAAAGVPITWYRIGAGSDLVDVDNDWAKRYGVADDGAVLVRPDGFIAWRAMAAVDDPAGVLRSAVDTVLERKP